MKKVDEATLALNVLDVVEAVLLTHARSSGHWKSAQTGRSARSIAENES